MWICLVLLLGLVALIATRRSASDHHETEAGHAQPVSPTCVVMRASYVPTGPRRPTGRRQRTHYAAPGR